MLHDEAPESRRKTIHLFWYAGFHLSACRKKLHFHFLGLCITRTLSDWLKISSRHLFNLLFGSLSTRVFETRTATGREHFACKESIVCQMLMLLISNGEKILSNVNVVVRGQVKSENGSLPVTVRVSKTRVLKIAYYILDQIRSPSPSPSWAGLLTGHAGCICSKSREQV